MNKLFCIVGPSGSGKSSISKELVGSLNTLALSISTTTRAPRGDEVEGKHYYFVSKEEFQRRIDQGSFIEYAQFGINFYGTEKRNFENLKTNLILDIEVQGVLQLQKLYSSKVIVILVVPPSRDALIKRLRDRKDTSEEEIERRLKIASREMEQLLKPEVVNYLVINDEFSRALESVKSIISAESNKISNYNPENLNKFRF